MAEHWAELKARKDKSEQGVSRLRSLTYRITFDAKKADPSMMNDVARFESSFFADISQVSVLKYVFGTFACTSQGANPQYAFCRPFPCTTADLQL